MKTWKAISALVLSFVLLFLASKVAALFCGFWQALFAEVRYDPLLIWVLPIMFVIFVYLIIHDLMSLATYKLGYESTLDDVVFYPEDGTTPLPRRLKFYLAYPFVLVVVALLLALWTKVVYCG